MHSARSTTGSKTSTSVRLNQSFTLEATAPAQVNAGATYTVSVPAQTYALATPVGSSNYTLFELHLGTFGALPVPGSAIVTAPGSINGFPLASSASVNFDRVGISVSSGGFGAGMLTTPAVRFEVQAPTTSGEIQVGAYDALVVFAGSDPIFGTCDLLTLLATTTVVGGVDTTTTSTTFGGPPPVTLSVDDVTIGEPIRGTVKVAFTVSLSAPTSAHVKVDLMTVDGTAQQPGDYRPKHGRLRLGGSRTSRIVKVKVRADAVSDPSETFALVLSNPVAATIADGTGIATIAGG